MRLAYLNELLLWAPTLFFYSLVAKNIFLESNVASGLRRNADCLWGMKKNEIKKESGAMDWKRKHCINQLAVGLDQPATDHDVTLN